MKCANCEALRETVQRLERELVLRQRHSELAAVQVAFGVLPQVAQVIMALYQANGRTLPSTYLQETLGLPADKNNVRVQISRARDGMESNTAIETMATSGWRMTPEGMSLVLAALQPPEIQDVRG